MRKVHFINPIDYMQGAIAKRQTGVVAESGVITYGSVLEKVNVSNYQQNLICHMGSKGSTNGKRWYSIRTKMSYTTSNHTNKAMAAFGGAASMYNAILENSTAYYALVTAYVSVKDKYPTFRQYVTSTINYQLNEKVADIAFEGTTSKIKNPWNPTGTGIAVTIPQAIIDKFETILAPTE